MPATTVPPTACRGKTGVSDVTAVPTRECVVSRLLSEDADTYMTFGCATSKRECAIVSQANLSRKLSLGASAIAIAGGLAGCAGEPVVSTTWYDPGYAP